MAFDPLDGSSNIDCNVSTGTIFAVYDKISEVGGNIGDVLRKGTDIKVRAASGLGSVGSRYFRAGYGVFFCRAWIGLVWFGLVRLSLFLGLGSG